MHFVFLPLTVNPSQFACASQAEDSQSVKELFQFRLQWLQTGQAGFGGQAWAKAMYWVSFDGLQSNLPSWQGYAVMAAIKRSVAIFHPPKDAAHVRDDKQQSAEGLPELCACCLKCLAAMYPSTE